MAEQVSDFVLGRLRDWGVPPLPPHIMKEQAKKSVKAEIHDPERMGLLSHGFRQKMVEYWEKLPGRDK